MQAALAISFIDFICLLWYSYVELLWVLMLIDKAHS